MDTDSQVHGDEAQARLLTYGCGNTTTQTYASRDTACYPSPLQRPSAIEDKPLNTALVQSAVLSETLTVTKEIISQTKEQSTPECTFLHSFLLNPFTTSLSSVFMSPPSSRSHLFSLLDDKTTLLSSDKEMSPWRGVEGHTRSFILLATL